MSAPTTTPPTGPGGATRRPAKSRFGAVRGFGRVREFADDFRRRTKDWLDRPMTSFHLIVAVFFLLLGFGLLMVLSASAVVAYRKDGSSFGTFKKQLMFAAIGMVAFYAAMRVKLNWLKAISTSGMLLSLGLLVVVLGMSPINGAKSWISVGPIGFQPSELAKFALVVWGAYVLASRHGSLGSWRELLIPVLPVACLMGGLIMLEPDLGTTAALMVIVFALFFFAGASWKLFALIAVVGVGGVVYLALSATYRYARVVSFLHPEDNAEGSGLQLLQGLYGMANGGWFGVGLGKSTAKWSYLPHAESDFIFAIVGEELGFVGAALLIGLYLTLAFVGLRIARRNVEPFVKLVAATSTAWLVGQASINIFYVVGLLPVTGLTLPMISAGGTSLVVTMTIFGLLANFARREPQALAVLQDAGPGRISRFFGIGVPGMGPEVGRRAARRAARAQDRAAARAAAEEAAVQAAHRRRAVAPDRDRPQAPSNGPAARRTVSPAAMHPREPRPGAAASAPRRHPARPAAAGPTTRSAAATSRTAPSGGSGGLLGWLGFGVSRRRSAPESPSRDSRDSRDSRAPRPDAAARRPPHDRGSRPTRGGR